MLEIRGLRNLKFSLILNNNNNNNNSKKKIKFTIILFIKLKKSKEHYIFKTFPNHRNFTIIHYNFYIIYII